MKEGEVSFSTEFDKPRHECAVVGIYHPSYEEIAVPAYYALLSLQNRGQESSGIAVFNSDDFHVKKDNGLVLQVFRSEKDIAHLRGSIALGHNRYGTTGEPDPKNAQPLIKHTEMGPIAISHNGNIHNADVLKGRQLERGFKFETTTDSEVLLNEIIGSPGFSWPEKIRIADKKLEGAYSFCLVAGGELIAARDKMGVWPLALGSYGEGYIISSESSALDYVGAKYVRDIEAGEILSFSPNGIRSERIGQANSHFCMFEFYYFGNPASRYMGERVAEVRYRMGQLLWQEHPVEAGVVIPVPETAVDAAEGFSEASSIKYRARGLTKNRWLWRTFIQPDQKLREIGVGLKYDPLPEIIDGKRVVLVDDSIVRGTNTSKLVQRVREAGAKEVHVRITAPPIVSQCYYGVDTASKEELIAANHSLDEIRDIIRADSLGYLSLESGKIAIGEINKDKLCDACFTGDYPTQVPFRRDRLMLVE